MPEILSLIGISAKSSFVSLPSPSILVRPSLSKFPSVVESPTTREQPGPSQPQPTVIEPLPSPKAAAKGEIYHPSSQDVEMASPTMATPIRNRKRKGKGKAPAVDTEELKARASAFARTSAVVRDALKRWAAKASERFLCNDAVRHSDAYTGQKTKRRHETGSQVNAEPEAKRTARTRIRRRVSAKYVPLQLLLATPVIARVLIFFLFFLLDHPRITNRMDADVAPGTFLAAVRTRVGNSAPFDYCLWLSLTQERWYGHLERKFHMPNAGAWIFECVFSVPLAPGAASLRPGWSCLNTRRYSA